MRLLHQPEADAAISLSDQAYYRLREMIVTLELAPGEAINERDLMERTQLGRTPIREALRTLANERLVEIFPRRGVLVAGVNAGAVLRFVPVEQGLALVVPDLGHEPREDAPRVKRIGNP